MKDVFKKDVVTVASGKDLVRITFTSDTIILYYPTVFKICSSMGGAARFAMRHEGVHPDLWNKLAAYDRTDITVPMHFEYRRSGLLANVEKWSVAFEHQLVVLQFDDLIKKFHYEDAAYIQVWMRRAAKEAKNWSGDTSRIWSTYARLTDAEENDKIVYAH